MANTKLKNQVLEPQVSELRADGVLKLPKLVRDQMNLKKPKKVWMYLSGDSLVVTPFVEDRQAQDEWIKRIMKARGVTLDDLIEETRKVRKELYQKYYA